MKSPRFFSAESAHGTSESPGFCNDTIVRVFCSKKQRDEYVESSDNISIRAIRANEATGWATNAILTSTGGTNAPRPFSGEFWAIITDDECNEFVPGQIGYLDNICNVGFESYERFYS